MWEEGRQTEKVWILKVLDEPEPDNDGSAGPILLSVQKSYSENRPNLHASHGYDGNKRKLGPSIHVQVPDEHSWEDGKGQVADDAEDAVDVSQGHDDFDIDTGPGLVLVPEEGDGVALEHGDEEEDDAGEDGGDDDAVDDPDVDPADGDAEEEVGDGDFGGYHGYAVPEVAEPPVLRRLKSAILFYSARV